VVEEQGEHLVSRSLMVGGSEHAYVLPTYSNVLCSQKRAGRIVSWRVRGRARVGVTAVDRPLAKSATMAVEPSSQ
jgi:hypothetical protein